MLFAGWATDRFFGGRAPRLCVFLMALSAACFAAFWFVPSAALGAVALCFGGFCLYGPQALTGVTARTRRPSVSRGRRSASFRCFPVSAYLSPEMSAAISRIPRAGGCSRSWRPSRRLSQARCSSWRSGARRPAATNVAECRADGAIELEMPAGRVRIQGDLSCVYGPLRCRAI